MGFLLKASINNLSLSEIQYTVVSAEPLQYEHYVIYLKREASKKGISLSHILFK